MTLYIENLKLGEYSNISFYAALEAYYNMGFEIVHVQDMEALEVAPEHIFLGSIQYIKNALTKLGCVVPEPLDYPEDLREFLGRKIWESTIDEIADNPENWNVFVKPKGIAKKFTGRLIQSPKDLIGCGDPRFNQPVWVSEPVKFVAEWRVFVRYGQILGARMYKGNWRAHLDSKVVEKALAAFKNAPAGFALDFGLTQDGRTLLVEANDGFALGNYGLFYIDYAKLLSARWAELTSQKDLCYF